MNIEKLKGNLNISESLKKCQFAFLQTKIRIIFTELL